MKKTIGILVVAGFVAITGCKKDDDSEHGTGGSGTEGSAEPGATGPQGEPGETGPAL